MLLLQSVLSALIHSDYLVAITCWTVDGINARKKVGVSKFTQVYSFTNLGKDSLLWQPSEDASTVKIETLPRLLPRLQRAYFPTIRTFRYSLVNHALMYHALIFRVCKISVFITSIASDYLLSLGHPWGYGRGRASDRLTGGIGASVTA